jgi:hypothetical protein
MSGSEVLVGPSLLVRMNPAIGVISRVAVTLIMCTGGA